MKRILKKSILTLALLLGMTFAAPLDTSARPRGYRTIETTMADGRTMVVVLYYPTDSEIPTIKAIYFED